ncbi:MAG TPA: CRISPR-associated endonuclease Cas2 [Brevefilum sp.]|nr:CRISPR-associated endonuclease Cas2 [Brevefilum sp.]HPL69515.1 CRISPR-associated endonuclease Cas2 [Brevefilum sp.]
MSERHFLVVVYDLSNDRRRTKLHKLLKNFGSPVQYSVFECLLTNEEIIEMKGRVKRLIRPKADHVRYYRLCKMCKSKTEVVGRVEILVEKDVLIV